MNATGLFRITFHILLFVVAFNIIGLVLIIVIRHILLDKTVRFLNSSDSSAIGARPGKKPRVFFF
jgi:hypothetical protein